MILVSNNSFEISLEVFMLNITTNHTITCTNTKFSSIDILPALNMTTFFVGMTLLSSINKNVTSCLNVRQLATI